MTLDDPIAILDRVVSGNVSDAMEQLGLPRRLLLGFHALGLQSGPVAGPAFTIEQRWKAPQDSRDAQRVRHGEATRGLAKSGDIIVIATGGIRSVATWGENHAKRCKQRGIRAMITDGATRDAAQVAAQGFPSFCRGFSPVKSRWDLQTVAMGERIYIDDTPIDPGDIMVADETGILIIAAEQALAVATLARIIRQGEEQQQGHFP